MLRWNVASLMMRLLAMIPLAASAVNADHTLKPPRNIDVAFDVDVVAGGSTGAVAAACEAAQQGARVFPQPAPWLYRNR